MNINEELLHDMIKVLELFDTASRLVSADHTLTLHLVVPTGLQLIKGIQRQAGEIEPVMSLKLRLQQFMDSHFPLHELHYMAVTFDRNGERG